MVGDAENEGPAARLDHSDRGVATERLTRNDADGAAGRSGAAAAADATREARGRQQQSDNDANRED